MTQIVWCDIYKTSKLFISLLCGLVGCCKWWIIAHAELRLCCAWMPLSKYTLAELYYLVTCKDCTSHLAYHIHENECKTMTITVSMTSPLTWRAQTPNNKPFSSPCSKLNSALSELCMFLCVCVCVWRVLGDESAVTYVYFCVMCR